MLKKIFSSAIVAAVSLALPQIAKAGGAGRHRRQSAPALRKNTFSHIRPEHRAALGRWLKKRASLRLAVESDCTNKENLEVARRDWGRGFHPYYSVGDFNRDGKEDFAVLLIDLKKEDRFAIAIFNGPFARKSAPNYFESGYDGISRCYIVYDKLIRRRLFLGVYESDVYCVTFYPRGGRYVFEDCLP